MSRLREMRISKGMTQIDVAERLDVKQATISQWESGTSSPRVETLLKLAELFDCTVDDLLKTE